MKEATAALLRTINDRRAAFERVHAAKDISFMEHALENMRIMGEAKANIDPNLKGSVAAQFRDMTTYFNRREEQNVRNLRWLIETGYAGRKIIIWAHNVHITNVYFEPGKRLHAVGKPYLFLDLRALDSNPSHAMRRPQAIRMFVPVPGRQGTPAHQGNVPVPDITRAFDAVIYVDQMTPATRIRAR